MTRQNAPISWSANQLRFQEWLATPKYDRIPPNQEALATAMGVHMSTLSKWKRLPGWQEAVNDLARASVGRNLPEIYGALLREAEKGSFQHIRLALELTGAYQETSRTELTGGVIVKIIEGPRDVR